MADEPIFQADFIERGLPRGRPERRDVLCEGGILADDRLVQELVVARQAGNRKPRHMLGDPLKIGRGGGRARCCFSLYL